MEEQMDNTQVTPFFKAKNHDKTSNISSCAILNIAKQNEFQTQMSVLEQTSATKAKEALAHGFFTAKQAIQVLINLESLKEAIAGYLQKNDTSELPNHIKTMPTFSEPNIERADLSESARNTFTHIGERARLRFIEEQTARASKYHIPINLDHVNFLELEQQIDEYEELLALARKQGIYWDTSIYDPLALAQALEDQDLYYRMERNDLYASFQATRGLEV